jgi:predicted transcriptional regulator
MSTVRISEASHRALRDLAECEKAPLQTVLERAIENYRRQRFLEAANRQYAALRADAAAWKQETTERAEWDRALGDGLDG